MKHLWMIIAGACIGVAATSLWLQHTDIAFVVATLGLVAWFLNYRARLKQIADAGRSETIETQETDYLG